MNVRLAAAVIAAMAASAVPSAAGTFNLTFENDRPAKTDRHFTHGTLLSWTTDEGAVPEGLKALGAELPGLATPPERASYILGQTMFTPQDISESRLIRDDRPYAGWLYGGLRLTSEQPNARQRLELDLGVIGPPSLANQTQTIVHKTIDTQVPNGWEHQLSTEPGVLGIYERGWRFTAALGDTPFAVAAMPDASLALGNVYTLAAAGGRLAIGHNLDASWGPPRIYPGTRGSGYFGGTGEFYLSLFVGAQGRAVARDIFLDGNTFRDSHSVDKRIFTGDIEAGLAIAYDRFRAAFTWVGRSREFDRQPKRNQFASMTLSVRF